MKPLLLSLALAFACILSYCQSGYEKGLIITQHDDTILCMVPSIFSFGSKVKIIKLDGKSETIPVNDIKYLARENFVFENLEFIKNQKTINKLMELRIEGKMNLYVETQTDMNAGYRMYDRGRTSYVGLTSTFVIKKDDITYLVEEENFSGLLKFLMADAPGLVSKIERDEYKYADIKELIAAYNKLDSGVASTPASTPAAAPDTVPPLHTIKESDISDVIPSFENQTLTVKLNDGTVYTYQHKDWDFEDHDPSLCQKLREAIHNMSITFTKTEIAPCYPGGEEAWNMHMQQFCAQHKKEIGRRTSEFTVQFIVHLNGQVSDVEIVSGSGKSSLSNLAVRAVQDNVLWVPAIQNGYQVVCYKLQAVKLSL